MKWFALFLAFPTAGFVALLALDYFRWLPVFSEQWEWKLLAIEVVAMTALPILWGGLLLWWIGRSIWSWMTAPDRNIVE